MKRVSGNAKVWPKCCRKKAATFSTSSTNPSTECLLGSSTRKETRRQAIALEHNRSCGTQTGSNLHELPKNRLLILD